MAKKITSAQEKKPKPALARGYCIRVQREGDYWLGRNIRVGWYRVPLLPPAWEEIQRDPQVIQAVLIRSGKKFATYHRPS